MYREEVDATKGMFRKKREKLQKFEYKLVQPDPADPVTPKVLPKVSGSMLSRRRKRFVLVSSVAGADVLLAGANKKLS